MLLWRNKVFPNPESIDPSITENGRHRHRHTKWKWFLLYCHRIQQKSTLRVLHLCIEYLICHQHMCALANACSMLDHLKPLCEAKNSFDPSCALHEVILKSLSRHHKRYLPIQMQRRASSL